MILTRDDMIRSGACFDKVQEFCERHDVYAGEVDKLLSVATPAERPYILIAANGDGYGNGDGYSYGYGTGDGYGYGYGTGDGYSYGYGDGYGYSYGDTATATATAGSSA